MWYLLFATKRPEKGPLGFKLNRVDGDQGIL